MKTIIKGMTLLLAGVMVMSCSKDVTFDENAQKQAKIEQQFAQYEANFVKRFGSIAATQDWGFGDEAKGIIVTRGESFEGSGSPVDCGFEVPNSITEHQNGNWANGAASQFANKGYTELDALYANYWVQHVNKPENGVRMEVKRIGLRLGILQLHQANGFELQDLRMERTKISYISRPVQRPMVLLS